jgi:hypothetical protein
MEVVLVVMVGWSRVCGVWGEWGKSPPRELKNISRHIISYFI